MHSVITESQCTEIGKRGGFDSYESVQSGNVATGKFFQLPRSVQLGRVASGDFSQISLH